MKLLRSLPSETKKDFFDRYANLIPTLFWVGVIAQLISFFTELSVVYNLVHTNLSDFPVHIDQNIISIVSWSAAILLSAFFEVGLRKFIPYSVRTFIYSRWKKLDKVMSIFILMIAISLVVGSVTFSFQGSKELVNVVSVPKKESKAETDRDYRANIADAKDQYQTDQAATKNSYAAQITSTYEKYQGKIDRQQSEIDRYVRKEQRNKVSYTSRKLAHRGNIANIKSEQGEAIAKLQEAQRKELANLSDIKRKSLKQAETGYTTKISSIDRRNRTTAAAAAEKAEMYGGGLAWFTVVCMVVLILSVVLDEVHKKGSGIVEQVVVNQYDFSNSAWSRFWKMLKEKWQSFIHRKITAWEQTTKAPSLPVLDYQLYDVGAIEQQRIKVEAQKIKNDTVIIPSRLQGANDEGKPSPKKAKKKNEEVEADLDHFSLNLVPENMVKNGMEEQVNLHQEGRVKIGGFLPSMMAAQEQVKNGKTDFILPIFKETGRTDRFNKIPDINTVQKLSDRSKSAHTLKQLKRVKKYYLNYLKKHGRKPSHKLVGDALQMTVKTAGKYVRMLKAQGDL